VLPSVVGQEDGVEVSPLARAVALARDRIIASVRPRRGDGDLHPAGPGERRLGEATMTVDVEPGASGDTPTTPSTRSTCSSPPQQQPTAAFCTETSENWFSSRSSPIGIVATPNTGVIGSGQNESVW
jgi:hypothetical protein